MLFWSCNSPAESPYPNLSFQPIDTMPGVGRASGVAFVIQNKAYITLGRSNILSDSLKTCWEFDPNFKTWTARADFPGIQRVNAFAEVVNDTAYVGLGYKAYSGGYAGANLKDLYIYVPSSDKWERKADFPSKTTVACVSFVHKGCIYVGAGFDDKIFSNEFWKYTPSLNLWTQLGDFPGPRRAGAAMCTSSEHIYFGTGYNSESQSDWWEYFPLDDSWKHLKSIPTDGRINAVALSVSNRYFVATGRHFGGNLTGGHVKADILEYDAKKNVWYERGTLPKSGRENAISFTINNKGYIGLGENDAEILNDIYSFQVE